MQYKNLKCKNVGFSKKEAMSLSQSLRSAKFVVVVKKRDVWGIKRYQRIDEKIQPFEWVVEITKRCKEV